MGETPSSKEASEVGSPTVFPHRWQSSRILCRRESPNPVVSRHAHYQAAEGQRESITDEPRPEDILGITGTMATEDSHHRQAKKEPTPSSRLSVWSVQNALLLRRSYRRSPHQTQTARWGRSPGKPHACASVVSPCTPPATWIQSGRGLSRVRGDSHARFLGGWGMVTCPGYPALPGAPDAERSATLHPEFSLACQNILRQCRTTIARASLLHLTPPGGRL